MTPEEKHRKKRYSAYAIMILGVLIFIACCSFLQHVVLVVLGMLVLLAVFIRKSVVHRRYREEVNQITETPDIDFSAMEHRHKGNNNE